MDYKRSLEAYAGIGNMVERKMAEGGRWMIMTHIAETKYIKDNVRYKDRILVQ